MPYMWADTLEIAERAHLLRLLAWSAASILAGTALVAWLHVARRRSDLLRHFGIQIAAWGLVEATMVAWFWTHLGPRDLAAATRLDRMLWLNIGLDAGYVLVGITLMSAALRLGKRLGLVGAGMGVCVQGFALALLDLALAAQISR
jgi:hypothetical protein